MKKLLVIVVALFLGCTAFSQAPDKLSYQAVVRDGAGLILPNRNVTIRISLLQSGPTGNVVYSEQHAKTTNSFGLANLEIGNGSSQSGSFTGINWGSGSYYVKVEIDPAAGTSFQTMGTTQLLSVPYALYAKNVQNKDDADADPANEIQILSLTGQNLNLSKGGGAVVLPGDNWGTQTVITDASLSGGGTIASPLGLASQGAVTGDFLGWLGTKWGPMKESQTLAVAGNSLTITGGNTVPIPGSPWGVNNNNIFFNTGNVGIGFQNPTTFLHIRDNIGMFTPQLLIENPFATVNNDASIGFGLAGTNPLIRYSIGITGTGEFKITNRYGISIMPLSQQNDGITMMRIFNAGITSFNNQSRSRAYQAQGSVQQIIPANIWQPVEFDNVSYNTHQEWMIASVGINPVGTVIPVGQSVFAVKEEGYYQVNARTEFTLKSYTGFSGSGYVSIAIFTSQQGAPAVMYAQGNKLQGSRFYFSAGQELIMDLSDNLAPNVSDVVYLKSGDAIEIRVFQNMLTTMSLVQGMSQTYVSVHKIS